MMDIHRAIERNKKKKSIYRHNYTGKAKQKPTSENSDSIDYKPSTANVILSQMANRSISK